MLPLLCLALACAAARGDAIDVALAPTDMRVDSRYVSVVLDPSSLAYAGPSRPQFTDARGAGETADGFSEPQRVAQATEVATEVTDGATAALDADPTAAVYIAVGTWLRMSIKLKEAERKGWTISGPCPYRGIARFGNSWAVILP